MVAGGGFRPKIKEIPETTNFPQFHKIIQTLKLSILRLIQT